MVDRLKRALEQVETPICPNCRIEMRWYRSTLIGAEPITIAHLFTCPNCQRVGEVKSTLSGEPPLPPHKLSAPRVRRAA